MSSPIAVSMTDDTTNYVRWRIIRTIAAKEWLEINRDARFRWLAALTLLLMACAVIFGAGQAQRTERDRTVAAEADRQLWTAQGAKNPHAGAHFGQYAFKMQSPLALADPGIEAYVGTAVWLEAHKQNEVQFIPAYDGGLSVRLGNLSLAFVLQTVMPLLVIMLGFSAFSGERERGTLRQLLSLGTRPLDLLAGKYLAVISVLAALLLPALAGVLLCCLFLVEPSVLSYQDQLVRLGWLVIGYGLYLGGFAALALAVSAFSWTSRAALVGLLAFWLFICFLAPRLLTDFVRDTLPLPSALEYRQDIANDKKKSFEHNEKHPAFIAFRDQVLRQYGVERVEDLPVNFRGLSLRESDEQGYRIYDRHFGALQEDFLRQDRWRAVLGFAVPFLAIQPYSMGMAGTDNRSHRHFASAAEQHRRIIQTIASDDLIHNGRYGDENYVADPEIWEKIPSFIYHGPQAEWVLAAQASNLFSLTGWFIMAALLAAFAVKRIRVI
ncbi:MAG: DUF3526 domain-containing protein [Proteobacteria bacterium]|nr:DUF3526 domain-containing protein [Desulfobulbaceae bacterium]MBU4151916.1 DUF3526 domain-containing protein [Pseudomonadota bacterium]MDP2104794.1 DUF3526 domain-containing protein [Desulfobulbaceae bacterium]